MAQLIPAKPHRRLAHPRLAQCLNVLVMLGSAMLSQWHTPVYAESQTAFRLHDLGITANTQRAPESDSPGLTGVTDKSGKENTDGAGLRVPEVPPGPTANPNPAEDTVSTVVGATQGQFRVEESGAASYSIPIQLAPSGGELRPQIDLSYSSVSGNGIAGMGWSLSGLSMINRCGQSLEAGDGINRGVGINANDRFCLDGQRLLLVSGTYGADGAIYRTEIDAIAKVQSVGAAGSGPSYFKVWRKDGTLSWYGAQSDSTAANPARILSKRSGDASAYAWAIGRMQDSAGNHMDFDWLDVQSANTQVETVLNKVRYGGHIRSGYTSLAPNNEIQFSYETRPVSEQSSGYLAGAQFTTTRRLKTIVSRADGLELRTYKLSYRADGDGVGRSALASVQECNGTLCYPATSFNWRRGSMTFSALNTSVAQDGTIANSSRYRGGFSVDLNGDGLADYLFMERDGSNSARPWLRWWLSSRDSGGGVKLVYGGTVQMASGIRSDATTLPKLQVVDINADGYSDVIYGFKASGASTTYFYGHVWSGSNLGAATVVGNTTTTVNNLQVLDWNGDGLGDLMYAQSGGLYGETIRVSLNQGPSSALASRFLQSVSFSVNYNSTDFPQPGYSILGDAFINSQLDDRIFDADGDGAVDVVLQLREERCNSGCIILAPDETPSTARKLVPLDEPRTAEGPMVSQPSIDALGGGNSFYVDRYIAFRAVMNSPTSVTLQSAGMVALGAGDGYGGSASRAAHLRMQDLNGDGLADAFYYSLNYNQWAYRLSTGTGFRPEVRLATTLSLPTDSNIRKHVRLYDVNGDGHPDILFPSSLGSDTALWRVSYWSWTSGGTYLAAVNTSVQTGNMNNGAVVEFGDYNGDGKLDALQLRPSSGSFQVRRGMGRNSLTASASYEAVHVIDQFTNGLGAYDKAIYKSLTQRSVYTRDRQGPYSGYGRQSGTVVYDVVPSTYVVAEARSLSSRYDVNATATGSTAALNGETLVQYYYTGAKVMGGGRGFLGFREVASFDPQNSVLNRFRYKQQFPYIGGVDESHRWYLPVGQTPWTFNEASAALGPCSTCANSAVNSAGVLLSRVANTWANRATSGGAVFPYLSQSQEWAYAPVISAGSITSSALTHRVVNANSQVDAYGNVGQVQTDSYTASSTLFQRQTTISSYTNNSSTWRLGRLTSAMVRHDRQGGSCNFATNPYPSSQCQQRTTQYSYDAATGILLSETLESGDAELSLSTTYTLDRFGNRLNTTISGAGVSSRTSSLAYDARGRYLVRKTNPYGQIESEVLSFDRFGNPTQVRSIAGTLTQFKYDSFGREYFRYSSTGSWVQQAYRSGTGSGICASDAAYYSITTTAGAPTAWLCYDKLGREVRRAETALNGSRRQVDTHYDDAGRIAEVSEPYYTGSSVYWARNVFDELGRPILTRNADGGTVQISYSGLSQTSTNPLNQNRTELRNVTGDVIQVTDHLAGVINYSYDAVGNLLSTDGPLANDTVSISYNRAGRKLSTSDPDKGLWQYKTNALGQVQCQLDAKGQLTKFTYDLLGRETQRQNFASGALSTCTGSGAATANFNWTYNNSSGTGNNKAQLSAESMSHNGFNYSRSFSYDSQGRPSVTTITMDGRSWSEESTYDQYGRLFQQFDAAGSELGQDLGVRFVYNSYGHLSQLREARDGATGKVYVEYQNQDQRGRISQVRYGNGLTSYRGFNGQSGRLESVITGANIQDLSFTWDSVGNLKQRRDRSLGRDQTENYAYDGLNRLLNVSLTAPAYGASNLITQRMRYDAAGNVLCKSDLNGIACTGTQTNQTYPASGRVHGVSSAGGVSYSYDANGNVTSDSSGRSFSYTSFERLYQGTRGSDWSRYFYAPDLSWVKRVSQGNDANNPTGETVWRIGNVEISEKSGLRELRRSIGGEVQVSHWAGNPNAQERYLHSDHLGSMDAVTDASGQLIDSMSFTAFGSRRGSADWRSGLTQTQLNTLRTMTAKGYTGHEMGDALGIIHMNGRIYDAKLGRFLQADPFVQAVQNSQSLNRYSYVLNNPLSYTDPSGFFFKSLFKAFKNFFVQVVARVVVNALLPGVGAFVGSFLSGFLAGAITGGSLKAGFFAGLQAGLAYGVGSLKFTGLTSFQSLAVRSLIHGVAQGAITKAAGGSFRDGFIGAAAGSLSTALPQLSSAPLVQAAQAAVVGGTVSELAGGSFANGAYSATFVFLFNHLAHAEEQGGGRNGYRITDEERQLLADGKVKEFWESRLAVGDPVASVALKSINPPGGILDGLFGGASINSRLQAFARVYTGSELDIEAVRLDLARAHARAVDLDNLNVPGLLNPVQIARYHHVVFANYGLPSTAFGGTPHTGSLGEANAFRWVWCRGCDD